MVNNERAKAAFPPPFIQILQEIHSGGPAAWIEILRQLSYELVAPQTYPIESFREIKVPIMVIVGDRDEVDEHVELYRQIPNSELAVIPQADHIGATAKTLLFAGFSYALPGLIESIMEANFGLTTACTRTAVNSPRPRDSAPLAGFYPWHSSTKSAPHRQTLCL